MNTITAEIQNLMSTANELKKQPGVDKKAINKVVARLEEAWLWSKEIIKPMDMLDPQTGEQVTAKAPRCTCPPGVIDKDCPVHGRA